MESCLLLVDVYFPLVICDVFIQAVCHNVPDLGFRPQLCLNLVGLQGSVKLSSTFCNILMSMWFHLNKSECIHSFFCFSLFINVLLFWTLWDSSEGDANLTCHLPAVVNCQSSQFSMCSFYIVVPSLCKGWYPNMSVQCVPQQAGWRWSAVEPGGWTRPATVRSEPCLPALWSPWAPRPNDLGCSRPCGTCRFFSVGNRTQ